MNNTTKAHLILLFCTLIWGATFALIRSAVAVVDPTVFVVIRFCLASLFFLVIARSSLKYSNRTIILEGLILGLFNTGVYVMQTVALRTTSSADVAFITALNVVFVPFFTPLFKLGKPSLMQVICCILSLVGIYILTGANIHGITTGDFWALGCAISFALAIVYLQKITQKTRAYKLLAFYQIFFTIPVPLLISLNLSYAHLLTPTVIVALLYCSIVATCMVFAWQTKYQRQTTAAKAALIYTLEPVFAVFFAYLINGEIILRHTVYGGLIVLLSVVASELNIVKFMPKKGLAHLSQHQKK